MPSILAALLLLSLYYWALSSDRTGNMEKNLPAKDHTQKPAGFVPAVEAATRAGAAYVHQTAYANGRIDGWEAGWRAAFSGHATTKGAAASPKKPHQDSARLDEPEGEQHNEEPPQLFELTEECVRLFARSMKAPKRQKQSHREPQSYDVEQLDLGGLLQKRRRYQAMKTYGTGARQIAELEAELSANFGGIVSDTGASYWPVVPLRDGERPMENVTSP